MDYPELDRDESIILQSQNVKFKSISFDAILTNRRIHLSGSKNTIIPSQDIILATIRNIETGENAIRDHFLVLSLVTDGGEKYQALLTFAKQAGVERKRECNEWAKNLKNLIPPPIPVIAPPVVPEVDREQLTKSTVPTPAQGAGISTRPARIKREITISQGTFIEKSPGASERRETPTLPSGMFCSRCGNRVPPNTPFCNNCGTPITLPSGPDQEPHPAKSAPPVSVPPQAPPEPVVVKVQDIVQPPVPQPVVVKVQDIVQPPVPQPVVVKGEETVQPPAGSPYERQGSSIEQVIHPIEPTIEESVPRTQQHPDLVQQQTSRILSEPISPVPPAGSSPPVVLPVFLQAESPAAPSRGAAPAVPGSPPPPVIPAPEGKKPNYREIGILILAILPLLVGLVIVANIIIGPSGGPANTTPVIQVATTSPPQLPQTLPPSITVTSLNGGETWQRGTIHTITWNYTGSPGSIVKIVLLKGGIEVGTIMDSTSIGSVGTGSYTWPISPTGTTGSDFKVSVQSISQPTIEDVSDDYFTLTSATTTPDNTPTTVPVRTENSTEVKKGLLNVTIGDYPAELPVFIDNKSAGVVSVSKPLNLSVSVGRHVVRICIVSLCNNQDVMVVSSGPAAVDFGDWLKNDVVTGPLTVSIGGYNAELPVLVDNITVGNISQGKPLDLMVSEGNHFVKVCVGILCVNDTVNVKFAQPSYIDFGERLKKIAEFPTPTVRIVDTRQDGAKVTVDLEFINPSKNDLTFTTTVQCAYSYIDPHTGWRKGKTKQITVTRSVRAGDRTKQSSDIWLDGGRSYMIEIPQILNTTTSR